MAQHNERVLRPASDGSVDGASRAPATNAPAGRSWVVTPVKPRVSRRLLAMVAAAGLIGLLSITDVHLLTEPASVQLEESAIDLPAVDRTVPDDAVVNVKSHYGAVGDGLTDDTAALQAAISAGLGWGNPNKVIYLPAGIYLVSRPLVWRSKDGAWSTWLTLRGANRDRTVIKLRDSEAGFGDPRNPQSVIVTGSQNTDRADGSGNQAFHNFIFDLTVDVGTGNVGANGIDYLASNRGAIRNVVVRAGIGSGNDGITMARPWPGPALLQDVRIAGFLRGIALSHTEYSITADEIRLVGQRDVGIDLRGNILSIRRLLSHNEVPAVRNELAGKSFGLLTILDSQLLGGRPGSAAIENAGSALLRGIVSDGYSAPVSDRGQFAKLSVSGDWSSGVLPKESVPVEAATRLPVGSEPATSVYPPAEWISVLSHGAKADDNSDDTDDIQAALDSGKPVVYFKAGTFRVRKTLEVPATVRAIVGFEAVIEASRGKFASKAQASVFRITEPARHPLAVEQILFSAPPDVVNFERSAYRQLVLQDIHISGTPFRGSQGPLYLTDVEGGAGSWEFSKGQQVWARQLNVEQIGTKIHNDGAKLWILGLKTEQPGMVVEGTRGGRTEIFGGLLYPVGTVPEAAPAFTFTNTSFALAIATSGYDEAHRYDVLVNSQNAHGKSSLTEQDVLWRGVGSITPFYANS